MLFYTIAGQKVALNGLYNTDNSMGEPMCPPILLSELFMLSREVGKELKTNYYGRYFTTTIHFVKHFLLESLLFLFFFLFHNCRCFYFVLLSGLFLTQKSSLGGNLDVPPLTSSSCCSCSIFFFFSSIIVIV